MTEPLRTINGALVGSFKRPASLGPVSEQRWLPITDLRIDPRYQRQVSPKGRRNVRAIAEQFSWSRFGTVVVAPLEGGLFAIVDGQHRTTAAAALGLDQVPCLIIQADAGEQARAFRAINAATTRVAPCQLHKAAVAAGDREALLVAELCGEAGIRILGFAVGAKDMKARDTLSVEALYRLARERRGLALCALRAVAAQAKDGQNLLRAIVLDAVRLVLAGPGEWWRDEARFIAALSELDLDQQWRLAMGRKAKEPGLSAVDALYQRLIVPLTRELGGPAA